jgi:hypothetical protein
MKAPLRGLVATIVGSNSLLLFVRNGGISVGSSRFRGSASASPIDFVNAYFVS